MLLDIIVKYCSHIPFAWKQVPLNKVGLALNKYVQNSAATVIAVKIKLKCKCNSHEVI